jgi:hypothetical protein
MVDIPKNYEGAALYVGRINSKKNGTGKNFKHVKPFVEATTSPFYFYIYKRKERAPY